MSRDTDWRRNTQGGEEDETPEEFHDTYQSGPRSGFTQDPTRQTGPRYKTSSKPGGGRIYEESTEQSTHRPRPTRQSQSEAYARLRQRPRQPIYSRNQEEQRNRSTGQDRRQEYPRSSRSTDQNRRQEPPSSRREPVDDYSSQQSSPRRAREDDYTYRQPGPLRASRQQAEPPRASQGPRRTTRFPSDYADYYEDERYNGRSYDGQREVDEYEDYEAVARRRRRSGSSYQEDRRKRRQRRGFFSTLLIGCLGGLITLAIIAGAIFFVLARQTHILQNLGKSTFTQSGTQSISLGNATQLIISNPIGNLSVTVDANATRATLTSTRKVLASSASDASNQFKQIQLNSQPITQSADSACLVANCLLIKATMPPASGGGVSTSSLDLTLTLPASVNTIQGDTLSATTGSGNITVSKFNGVLNLTDTAGNITVNQSLIFAGTCVQTMHGNVNVGQGSILNITDASNHIPCSNTTSNTSHPWFNFTSGIGNIDVTLPSPSTNILLNANTNSGKITDDFGIAIPSAGDGSATYDGPLLPHTNPTASLYLITSTGNIGLHKP